MAAETILVVDDETEIRNLVQEILEDEGYTVSTAENGEQARSQMERVRPDLVLLDIWMPDIDGITVLKEWKEQGRMYSPVIMMSGHGNVETAVEATKLGAYDYLEKPLSLAKLLLTIKNALDVTRLQNENLRLRQSSQVTPEIIGKSEMITTLREQLERICNHDTPVLILGESGTDKESIAKFIHNKSERHSDPFVSVNVSALGADTAVAELFGEDTGQAVKHGYFTNAGNGTLFLKDIADLDLTAQAQLHNTLEKQSFKLLNSDRSQELDVRVIAASRQNLGACVKDGTFRDDLYFQLNIVPIQIPPLRDHYEDIPELLNFYVNYFVDSEGLAYRHFSTAAQNRLRRYGWPGNTRELRNLVQRLLIMGADETIELEEVEMVLGDQPIRRDSDDLRNFDLPLREARENFEKAYLEYQLKQANGSVSKIAKIVGMERTHLYRKLKSLGIDIKN